MVFLIFFFALLSVTFGQVILNGEASTSPTSSVSDPEYLDAQLESIKQKIMDLDSNFSNTLFQSEVEYQEYAANKSIDRKTHGEHLSVILKFREIDYYLYEGSRQGLLSDYQTNFGVYMKFLESRVPNDFLVLDLFVVVLNEKILEFNFYVLQSLYQLSDPEKIKIIPSTQSQGLLELDKSSKDLIEKKLLNLDSMYQVIKKVGKRFDVGIQQHLEFGSSSTVEEILDQKKRIDEIYREEDNWYSQKRLLISSKLEPSKVRNVRNSRFSEEVNF